MEKEAFSLSCAGRNVGRGARDEAEFVALGRRPSTRRSGNFSPSLSISLFSRFRPSPSDYTHTYTRTCAHTYTHAHTSLVRGVGTSLDSARTSLESPTLFHAYTRAGVSSSRYSLSLSLFLSPQSSYHLFFSLCLASPPLGKSRAHDLPSRSLPTSTGKWVDGALARG